MKLINTTDIPTHLLRRLIGWVCKRLDLPVRYVREVALRKSKRRYGGLCRGRRVGLRIGTASQFPAARLYGDPVVDREECLVWIAAHELGHVAQIHERSRTRRQFERTGNTGGSERYVERLAQGVLDAFRTDRPALWAAWSAVPAPRAKVPTKTIVERRAEKARAMLERWQRKAKLATTKVKAYRRKVRYYEKRLATAAVPKAE